MERRAESRSRKSEDRGQKTAVYAKLRRAKEVGGQRAAVYAKLRRAKRTLVSNLE